MPRIVYAAGETAARPARERRADPLRRREAVYRSLRQRLVGRRVLPRRHAGSHDGRDRRAPRQPRPTKPSTRPDVQASDFAYAIPVTPGLYCVRLKLAEPECDYFFERPMNLDINGRRVLRNFDICHAARGPRRAYERVFRYLVPMPKGSSCSGSPPGGTR